MNAVVWPVAKGRADYTLYFRFTLEGAEKEGFKGSADWRGAISPYVLLMYISNTLANNERSS